MYSLDVSWPQRPAAIDGSLWGEFITQMQNQLHQKEKELDEHQPEELAWGARRVARLALLPFYSAPALSAPEIQGHIQAITAIFEEVDRLEKEFEGRVSHSITWMQGDQEEISAIRQGVIFIRQIIGRLHHKGDQFLLAHHDRLASQMYRPP